MSEAAVMGRREIVFDTETTGFDAKGLDRITEIGCVEVVDLLPTGNTFHAYLDPQRDVPEKVVELTGLTTEFLTGKPLFKDRAQDFIDFIGDSPMVAHNADFDRGFINAELERAGFDPLPNTRFKDTLKMAREQFPGSPATLDALCKRFDVSLQSREKHGALVDSYLLAEVYLELCGGRMHKLGLEPIAAGGADVTGTHQARQRPEPIPIILSEAEVKAHESFITAMGGDEQSTVWQYYWKKKARRA